MDPLGIISEFFHTFIIYEPELEQSRIVLAANLSFDPYHAFKLIDQTESGFVRADELYEFFHRLSVRVELRYVFALVKSYSTHSEGKIFIADFFNIILPHTKVSLREDAMRRQGKSFQEDHLPAFLRIFQLEFEMWEKIERLKFDFNSEEFNTWKIFCSIDVPRSGFLSPGKVKRLMDRYGKVVEEYMVGISIARLDKDRDFMLSFEEFAWGLGTLAEKEKSEEGSEEEEEEKLKNQKKKKSNADQGGKNKSSFDQSSKNKSNADQGLKKKPIDAQGLKEKDKRPTCSLRGLLQIVLDVECALDKEKKKLISAPDFNLTKVFLMFDPNNLGFSTESDFADALVDLGLKAGKEEISLLFKHYSQNYCKRLTHAEIEKIFLPYLETNVWQTQDLHPDTLNKVKLLMEQVIRAELIYEKYRQLLKREKVSEKEAFGLLGRAQVGSFELKQYFMQFQEINEKEISWILLFFKKTLYETFDFQEFSAEFLPKSRTRITLR